MTERIPGIDPAAEPSGTGCKECLIQGTWWLHLRRCAECGHIGCCDSSPFQHAAQHFHNTGHPIISTFEPDERWFYNYETETVIRPVPLAPPLAHPEDQPVPGPAGRVPQKWQSMLNPT